MKRAAVLFTFIAIVIATNLSIQSATAQDSGASAGAVGSADNNGPTTWQAGENTGIVPAAPVGQTLSTLDSALQSRGIAPAQMGGIAGNSVNQNAVPSGAFSFGFPQSPQSSTTDSYTPSGLPTTSTGSVDLNTADCPYCGQGLSIWGW